MYYQHEYVSPAELYAIIKHEMASYFDTGVLDDIMFPVWTDFCLRHLGKGVYKIEEGVFHLENYSFKLPPDFSSIREAWVCTTEYSPEIPTGGSVFHSITTKIGSTEEETRCKSSCDPCAPERVEAFYKTDTTVSFAIQKEYLLKPGNATARQACHSSSPNLVRGGFNTFDVRNGKFLTNFSAGDIYLIYYSKQTDEDGNQLIPDNIYVQDYIGAYIRYKLYEILWNTVSDETYNQVQNKLMYYENKMNEAVIVAKNDGKKKTDWQRVQDMKKTQNSLNRFKIR